MSVHKSLNINILNIIVEGLQINPRQGNKLQPWGAMKRGKCV